MIIKNQPPQPEEGVIVTDNGNGVVKAIPSYTSYNWEVLKKEFMQGPWGKIIDFKKDKGIPLDSSYLDVKMKGWAKEKKQEISEEFLEESGKLVEIKPNEIQTVRKRQAVDARLLQQKGLLALEVLEPKTVDDARKLIVTGMQEERAALGISEKGGQPSSLTQVNLNLPKTKLDKIINGQDFAGLLKFIAEVKRERTRRVGDNTSSESKATTG